MKKLSRTFLAVMIFLPTLVLFARDDTRLGRNYGSYDTRKNEYYNYGDHYGGYGGYGQYGGYGGYGGYAGYGGYGYGVINPYPDAQSQPGMSDDSNALYQSYLRHDEDGY